MMLKSLIIIMILFGSNGVYALEKKLKLQFWFDNKPPTSNDNTFFNGVRNSIEILDKNNKELEKSAQKRAINIVDYDYAKRQLNTLLKEHYIKEDFFYDAEKVQLVMVIRMLFNHCRVSGECSEATAKQYANQFVEFANQQTSKGRDRTKKRAIDERNNAILLTMLGAVAVSTVSNIIEGFSESKGITSSTSSLKYGCEFYCEGQFGLKRSETFRVNTPYTNSADAQEYVRKEYEAQCKRYPFFSSGGGASVSYPKCETYHYKN